MILSYTSVTAHILNNYKKFLYSLFSNKFNICILSTPIKRKKKTFLKSPHVNKKAKENFVYTIYSFKLIMPYSFNLLKILKFNVPKTLHFKFKILSKIFYKKINV